jgi:hypothetical protein
MATLKVWHVVIKMLWVVGLGWNGGLGGGIRRAMCEVRDGGPRPNLRAAVRRGTAENPSRLPPPEGPHLVRLALQLLAFPRLEIPSVEGERCCERDAPDA